jgi:hypothetical protein
MKTPVVLAFICWALSMAGAANARDNTLPADFAGALAAPEHAELYSLEPGPHDTKVTTFYGYQVLGHTSVEGADASTAANQFTKAVAQWNGAIGACFEPREGLSVQYGAHRYDFVICFTCQQMQLYRDQKPVGEIGVTGDPDKLKALLAKHGVTLSHSDDEARRETEERGKKAEAALIRVRALLPPGLRGVWEEQKSWWSPDLELLRTKLKAELPDRTKQILLLLAWFGTDSDLWSGFPIYEEIPDRLLLDYSTPEILEVAQSTTLDGAQIEGLARFLAGWNFYKQRPNDLVLVPLALKQTLLAHSLKSDSNDKKERARSAFEGG